MRLPDARKVNQDTTFEAGVVLACFDEMPFTLRENASHFSMMLARIVVRCRFFLLRQPQRSRSE
jgi:hypothetical protein